MAFSGLPRSIKSFSQRPYPIDPLFPLIRVDLFRLPLPLQSLFDVVVAVRTQTVGRSTRSIASQMSRENG
jgi:hypothetical protein